jgi:hypothetical protein
MDQQFPPIPSPPALLLGVVLVRPRSLAAGRAEKDAEILETAGRTVESGRDSGRSDATQDGLSHGDSCSMEGPTSQPETLCCRGS